MTAVYDDLDPAYAAICSEATLQSNVKGFFKPFVDHVTELATKDGWLQNILGKRCGDIEKLNAVLEYKELMDTINETLSYIKPMYRGKAAPVSQERRQEAQVALKNGDLQKALALSSQAVLRAPMPGENELVDGGLSLAFGLWVRSEILMQLGQYDLALGDLKLALKERLPAKQRGDYYWRMGNCYRGARQTTKAKVSYDLAARLVAGNPESRARLELDIHQLQQTAAAEPATEAKKPELNLTAGAKENMPSLSKLVKIVEETDKGRYAVAGAQIKTGDVLLVERPYTACLLPEYFGSHCCHCFKRLVAPVWCPKCSGVAFCSSECRDVAIKTYHPHECNFSDLFIGSGMSILSHIALRMVTQAGLEMSLNIHSKYISNGTKTVEGAALNDIEGAVKTSKFKSRKDKLSRGKKNPKIIESEKKEPTDSEKDDKDDNLELKAAQIYSLCTHEELRNPKDFLQRILMTLFLVNCLKKASFFGKENNAQTEKAERAISELLLRNLQLLQFNAHELYETVRTSQHKFNGAKACYIAVAIYPTGALFNHECYPAVGRYFDGTKIVLKAIRPLRPGETIAENYGPQFLVRAKAERQRALACRYWFKCQCRACLQDWPTLKQMSSGADPFLKCSNNACERAIRCLRKGENRTWPHTCPNCGCAVSQQDMASKWKVFNKCMADYQVAAEHMDAQEVAPSIEKLCSALDLFHELCVPPHCETHLAQEALRSCFADTGNVHIMSAITH